MTGEYKYIKRMKNREVLNRKNKLKSRKWYNSKSSKYIRRYGLVKLKNKIDKIVKDYVENNKFNFNITN